MAIDGEVASQGGDVLLLVARDALDLEGDGAASDRRLDSEGLSVDCLCLGQAVGLFLVSDGHGVLGHETVGVGLSLFDGESVDLVVGAQDDLETAPGVLGA